MSAVPVRVRESHSPEETIAIAEALAREHPAPAIFYLEGELGAGKTLFAKGIAAAYGVPAERVVSPTFALVNRYGGGRRVIYHIDLYRIETERELAELGLEEMEAEDAVVVYEWAEKLGRYRRADAVVARLQATGESSRTIVMSKPG